MTDNEIIKTLECCTTKGVKCSDCPAFKKVDRSDCKKYFRGAIDLINRQQAEIERYERENNSKFDKWKLLDDRTKQRYAELYEEAKSAVKSEAIKEFAERLKEEWFNNRYDSPDIDFDYFIDLVIRVFEEG